MKNFEVLEHTSDVGLLVRGRNLSELLIQAAKGLYFLLGWKEIKEEIEDVIESSGIDNESLLINWLNELIYLCFVKKRVYSKFTVEHLDEQENIFKIRAKGEEYDKFKPLMEIKAATYHDLKIERVGSPPYLRVKIIFDI